MNNPKQYLDNFVLNLGGREEGDSILLTTPISDVQIRVDQNKDLYLHWNNETMSTMSSVIDQYKGLKDGDVQLTKSQEVFGCIRREPIKQPYLTEDEIVDLTRLVHSIMSDYRVRGYQDSATLSTGQRVVIFKQRVYLNNVAVLNVISSGHEFTQTRYGLPNNLPTDVFCELITVARNILEVGTHPPKPINTTMQQMTVEKLKERPNTDSVYKYALEHPTLKEEGFVLNVRLPTPLVSSHYITDASDTQIVLKGDSVFLRVAKESDYLRNILVNPPVDTIENIELARKDPHTGTWMVNSTAHFFINMTVLYELLDLIAVLKGDTTKPNFQGSATLSTGQTMTLYRNAIYIDAMPEFGIGLIHNPSRQRPTDLFGFIHSLGMMVYQTSVNYDEVFEKAHLILMKSVVELDPRTSLTIKGFDHMGTFVPSETGNTSKKIHYID